MAKPNPKHNPIEKMFVSSFASPDLVLFEGGNLFGENLLAMEGLEELTLESDRKDHLGE
jgi:hypothetical protein